ncbi:MAG: TatD family hydrolase [Candidatus Brocadiaceae bacterium]|jgi:TatD DNase family protein
MEIIDTHTHLNLPEFEKDLEAVLERARRAGVAAMLCVGMDLASSRRAVRLARAFPDQIRAAVGIHPNHWGEARSGDFARIEELATAPEVIAIGETGLDLFRGYTGPQDQALGFRRHLVLARALGKPVIIHSRKADPQVLEVLGEEGNRVRGVRHCFDRPAGVANQYLDLGFHLSVAAAVSRPGYKRLKQALRSVPIDRLLVETDCPYQTPEPHGQARNEPAFITANLRGLAEVIGTDAEELAARTTANARTLLGLP